MRLAVVGQLIAALQQAEAVLRQLGDEDYAATGAPAGQRGGVGVHLRHSLDVIEAFLDGLGEGRVDYDRRRRNQTLEQCRSGALSAVKAARQRLEPLATLDPALPIQVRMDPAPGEKDARCWNSSSAGRELVFLLSHTVHHQALMALLLRVRGLEPGAEFGVAPSTLAHWSQERGP